jgi:TetR/AcrR family transcriptional regulator, fatty acid metabolism regulator protein
MPTISKPNGSRRASFIETHRKKQIIETAIKTIAEQGFPQASLASIAKAAGISKGVISYYFKGKDDLIEQIKSHLMIDMAIYARDRVGNQEKDLAKLLAYIDANFAYARENREKFMVLLDLGIHLQNDDYGNPFSAVNYQACRHRLENILNDGNRRGAFRVADVRNIAVILQGIIDGVCIQYVAEPEAIDLDECSRHVQEMMKNYLNLPVM